MYTGKEFTTRWGDGRHLGLLFKMVDRLNENIDSACSDEKANAALRFISQRPTNNNSKYHIAMPLYKSIAWSHLE